jgi:hypothetical protein
MASIAQNQISVALNQCGTNPASVQADCAVVRSHSTTVNATSPLIDRSSIFNGTERFDSILFYTLYSTTVDHRGVVSCM